VHACDRIHAVTLIVENAVVDYGDEAGIRDVSFTLPGGTVAGLVGPNGSGKTTLLRFVAGIPHPGAQTVSGSVLLQNPATHADQEVVFVSDSSHTFAELSPEENLLLLGLAMGLDRPEALRRASASLRLVGADRYPSTSVVSLSLGMRRRLDIALAVHRRASVYIFDEPFNGLDVDGMEAFRAIVAAVSGTGRIVLIASHAVATLAPMCDLVLALDSGRVERTISAGPDGIAVDDIPCQARESRAVLLPWP
jgi:ABC-2 type transport system ATP-binding protein